MDLKLFRVYVALFFALVFAFSVKADEVDKFVRAVMQERQVPGAAIAVVKNGKIEKKRGTGVASVKLGVPATTKTFFKTGSEKKQMTAAAVMLLVEDGKINPDAQISVYLPNTPAA